MRKSRFTESQIVGILKEGEAGIPIAASALGPSHLPRRRTGTGGVVCPARGRRHAGRGTDRGAPAGGRGPSPLGLLEVP